MTVPDSYIWDKNWYIFSASLRSDQKLLTISEASPATLKPQSPPCDYVNKWQVKLIICCSITCCCKSTRKCLSSPKMCNFSFKFWNNNRNVINWHRIDLGNSSVGSIYVWLPKDLYKLPLYIKLLPKSFFLPVTNYSA